MVSSKATKTEKIFINNKLSQTEVDNIVKQIQEFPEKMQNALSKAETSQEALDILEEYKKKFEFLQKNVIHLDQRIEKALGDLKKS